MDILNYMERIDTLNQSANSNVNAADYESALIDLAQAYGLQRMLLTYVLSFKYPRSSAERPIKVSKNHDTQTATQAHD